ncbi:unnamed protein product [Didymodactylos carnosus]|uniref:Uncharacterized protein n=1 Tax=Didymodactylos carnosus TaxID=1234261 RepID=A0A8S2D9M5_9BILA|nr:unnamed protein product [Didymodactylos carnosus]CAF3662589.1 unnamed protein product [Didymodactylos carnosus]
MILLDNDLEWVFSSAWKEELPKIIDTTLYESLNKARNARYESKCGAKELGIKQCKRDHKASKDFLTALSTEDMGKIKAFFNEQNKGANFITASSRTVLLMNATGSISNKAFMNTIGPEGGWGHEAIEIGLWHAVKESETPETISQVILITDAPANSQTQLSEKRTRFGEAYWKTIKFSTSTYYATELQKLEDKKFRSMHFTSLHTQKEISKKLRVRHQDVVRC